MQNLSTEVLIIGAGPAGTIAAAQLLQLGRKVTILEKQKFPRFVIGESLLPRCMDHLSDLGLLDVIKEHNFQIKRGACFCKNDNICSFDFSEQYTKGWDWTWQVPREEFDKVLADEVEKRGAVVHYETAVEAVQFHDNSTQIRAKNANGEVLTIDAEFMIDASGYGRVLPRLLDLNVPSEMPARSAVFGRISDPNRKDDLFSQQIAVYFYQKMWVWVIPFSNGTTSIGFVDNTEVLNELGSTAQERFEVAYRLIPELEERFGAEPKQIFEAKQLNGYSIAVKRMYGERFVLAGNSTEFLDPIFSSGVTFAMESGRRAAQLCHQTLNAEQVDWETNYTKYLEEGINVFRSYVNAWYDGTLSHIFFSKTSDEVIKHQICSVLAGYVWDKTNPYARKHKRALKALSRLIQLREQQEISH